MPSPIAPVPARAVSPARPSPADDVFAAELVLADLARHPGRGLSVRELPHRRFGDLDGRGGPRDGYVDRMELGAAFGRLARTAPRAHGALTADVHRFADRMLTEELFRRKWVQGGLIGTGALGLVVAVGAGLLGATAGAAFMIGGVAWLLAANDMVWAPWRATRERTAAAKAEMHAALGQALDRLPR